MSNLETAAKQDLASARSGLRAWMADHPFAWGALAGAAGALAAALASFVL